MNEQQKSQRGQEMPHYTEEEARAYFESRRWPNGVHCAQCDSRNCYELAGTGHRRGLYQCRDCRGQFTVTVGTVMVDSHLPLSTWAKAFHYMATSKKGVSALFLMRSLGLGSYRTAWHLAHRIREAMKGPIEADTTPLEGIVEVDETYVGGKFSKGRGCKDKSVVVSLVERGGKGRKRSVVMERVTGANLRATIKQQTTEAAEIQTDCSALYNSVKKRNKHARVNHDAGEYVRYRLDGSTVTTNTVEGSFSLLKRGIMGQFHSVSKKHLHRYCVEFDARWNLRGLSDVERRDEIVKGAEGRYLPYKTPIARLAL